MLDLPSVHLAADHPRELCERMCRTGVWHRVRRGAYVEWALAPQDPFERRRWLALAHVAAVLRQTSRDSTVSHASAALLWGLPLLAVESTTHLTQRTRAHSELADDVVRHFARHGPDDVVEMSGITVTGLERTVVDCAATLGAHAGLVVADAALARGANLTTCEAIAAAIPGRRGIRTVRAVLGVADGGAESPGETTTRLVVLRAGLPRPVTQVCVETRSGRAWGDVGWPEHRLLLEHDGRSKYRSAEGAGRDGAGVVLLEKQRQAALEEAGWRVLRVTASDLRHPPSLLRRIGRAAPALMASATRPSRDLMS